MTATERTLAKYRTRPFDWRTRSTCIHMARFHARGMGHRPPPVPSFRSAIGARRALASTGHASVTELLDSLFDRIAPAAMLVGDLAVVPGEDGWDAVMIHAGAQLLGWHEDGDGGIVPVVPDLSAVSAAWRL